jgi:pimeloyl-ACP methyl ester carboxylesterase
MATVFAAQDTRHGRRVAVKVLRPDLARTMGAERFLREIAITASLQHPHILGLLDSGAADGVLYYVMPFVDGVSLRARLEREGELPIDAGLRLLREVLDALSHAHHQGIVHRDIKPENVMLSGYSTRTAGRWHAMLADFGIAKAITAAASTASLTQSGIAVGTPAYMAPEQAAADPQVDHRADIYAVGALGYEVFAGTPPFTGPTAQHVIAAHMTQTPESLSRRRPAIPPELDELISLALEKRPADRWQSADDMLGAVERLVTSTRAATIPRAQVVERKFRISESVCRRLDRATLDPGLIGSEMQYIDNGVRSDTLVYCIHGTGQDQDVYRERITTLPYHAIAPTLIGFERERRSPLALPVVQHIGLLREFLRSLLDELRPRTTVITGFSSGGDLALQLVGDSADSPAVDGILALAANLAYETCFVTRVFRELGGDETELLNGLRQFGETSADLDSWIKVHEYLVSTFRKFGKNVDAVRKFSADYAAEYQQDNEMFAKLYRAASARVPVVRCVWEEAENTVRLVNDLRMRNLFDGSVLGDNYKEGSLVIERGAGHFDLFAPDRFRKHLDEVIRECQRTEEQKTPRA